MLEMYHLLTPDVKMQPRYQGHPENYQQNSKGVGLNSLVIMGIARMQKSGQTIVGVKV